MPVENVTQKKFITNMATEISRCEDGEIKYLRQNPYGKCDEHIFWNMYKAMK